MERHSIGTDATVPEHIKKQLDRGYATKDAHDLFWPTRLGEALIAGYKRMGLANLWKPDLRSFHFSSWELVLYVLVYCKYNIAIFVVWGSELARHLNCSTRKPYALLLCLLN